MNHFCQAKRLAFHPLDRSSAAYRQPPDLKYLFTRNSFKNYYIKIGRRQVRGVVDRFAMLTKAVWLFGSTSFMSNLSFSATGPGQASVAYSSS